MDLSYERTFGVIKLHLRLTLLPFTIESSGNILVHRHLPNRERLTQLLEQTLGGKKLQKFRTKAPRGIL